MILNGYFEKQLLPVNNVYNYPKCFNSSLETLRRKGRQAAFSADLMAADTILLAAQLL